MPINGHIISHIPYIFSIFFMNNKIEIFLFYFIFLMTNYNIKYITKLLIFLNCYKKSYDLFKLFLLSNVVSYKYEKWLSIGCCFYYFYSNIINTEYFYLKLFCLYIVVGSNINICFVYNIHLKAFLQYNLIKELSLQNYMIFVNFTKNVFICIYIIY